MPGRIATSLLRPAGVGVERCWRCCSGLALRRSGRHAAAAAPGARARGAASRLPTRRSVPLRRTAATPASCCCARCRPCSYLATDSRPRPSSRTSTRNLQPRAALARACRRWPIAPRRAADGGVALITDAGRADGGQRARCSGSTWPRSRRTWPRRWRSRDSDEPAMSAPFRLVQPPTPDPRDATASRCACRCIQPGPAAATTLAERRARDDRLAGGVACASGRLIAARCRREALRADAGQRRRRHRAATQRCCTTRITRPHARRRRTLRSARLALRRPALAAAMHPRAAGMTRGERLADRRLAGLFWPACCWRCWCGRSRPPGAARWSWAGA